MYIERDWRRQAAAPPGGGGGAGGGGGKPESQQAAHMDYLGRCLELLIGALVELVPDLGREIIMALESVAGRKHPSTIQIKQLKTSLPMMPVLQHFITSQVFRPRVINAEFMATLGQLVAHVQSIDSGSTHVQAATGASNVGNIHLEEETFCIVLVFIVCEAP